MTHSDGEIGLHLDILLSRSNRLIGKENVKIEEIIDV